jgi:hypothetical protein
LCFQNLELSTQTTIDVLQKSMMSMQAAAEKNLDTMGARLAAQTHEESVRTTGLDPVINCLILFYYDL